MKNQNQNQLPANPHEAYTAAVSVYLRNAIRAEGCVFVSLTPADLAVSVFPDGSLASGAAPKSWLLAVTVVLMRRLEGDFSPYVPPGPPLRYSGEFGPGEVLPTPAEVARLLGLGEVEQGPVVVRKDEPHPLAPPHLPANVGEVRPGAPSPWVVALLVLLFVILWTLVVAGSPHR